MHRDRDAESDSVGSLLPIRNHPPLSSNLYRPRHFGFRSGDRLLRADMPYVPAQHKRVRIEASTYYRDVQTIMKKLFLAVFLVASVTSVSTQPQAPSPKPQAPLTVDSIMRGPELVGNPPNNLRWSGDSKELYFEWQMPKEDQAATWVVGRDGGTPRRLTDAERRSAPLANGQWDAKRRRILGVDRGDVVIIDTV